MKYRKSLREIDESNSSLISSKCCTDKSEIKCNLLFIKALLLLLHLTHKHIIIIIIIHCINQPTRIYIKSYTL